MKKLTITVEDQVCAGLRARVGPRRISAFLNALAKPLVTDGDLDAGYRQMAADREREQDAHEWAEAFLIDVPERRSPDRPNRR